MTSTMRDAAPITVMIFTLNEEIHLPACLESLTWCDDVIVIDSLSTDRTRAICEERGVRFFERAFDTMATQRNWALLESQPKHDWVLILDADERVTPELAAELDRVTADPAPGAAAYRIRRRFHMWGRWLPHSSLYPTYVVRLIDRRRVRYVDYGHGEIQEVAGETLDLRHDLVDENLKGIVAWFQRQARYAYDEALHELTEEQHASLFKLFARDPIARRMAQKAIGKRLPGRAFAYFAYSYLLRGGFREGRDGLIFCVMRSLYQQMIVASKHEISRSQALSEAAHRRQRS